MFDRLKIILAALALILTFPAPYSLADVIRLSAQASGGGVSLSGTNTWTGAQTFTVQPVVIGARLFLALNNGMFLTATENGTTPAIFVRTEQTPDTAILGTGTISNSWAVMEQSDIATDVNNGPCAGASCTDTALIVYGNTPSSTNYNAHAVWGSARRTVKSLTESAATSTLRIPIAAEAGTGGVYYYTIYATNGSTPQVRQGRVIFSVTNDGGVETCVLGTPEETDNTPTGTLTVAVTCDTTPANAVDFQLNAVSDLVQTTLEAYSSIDLIGPGQPGQQ